MRMLARPQAFFYWWIETASDGCISVNAAQEDVLNLVKRSGWLRLLI